MKKEIFDKIQEAGLFDLYGAEVKDSDTNAGVFIKKANAELVKITMSNFNEAFDLNIPIQNQN